MESKYTEKLTQAQKNAQGKKYYKDRILNGANLPTEISTTSFTSFGDEGVDNQFQEMKIWYDMYNGIIHRSHFTQYCTTNKLKAFAGISENLVNRDIVSSRIDTILGVESSRPFKYQAIAVNPEATTAREEKENEMLQQYVMERAMGKEVDRENLPPKIQRYVRRKFQVPQEMMANQVLKIGEKRQRLNTKFLKGLKHMALSSRQIYHVHGVNGEPTVDVVNPLHFDVEMGKDNEYTHLANAATAIYEFHPAEICHRWKDELTNKDIDRIWESATTNTGPTSTTNAEPEVRAGLLRVVHRVWRGMRKVGFLTYTDAEGAEQMVMVSDNYKINKEQGDIKISWEWLEEIHEGYKILDDIFVQCGPVKYQHVISGDLQRPWLPYVGGIHDAMNSHPVSKMGRMMTYQYFYDIIYATIDRLISNDKGKKLGINMSAIPASLGIGMKELISHMEEDDIIPLNPNEEGNRRDQNKGGISSLLTSVDLSPASQLQMYERLGEMTYQKAGLSIGITPQMEGAVKEREAAANVQNSINLSSSKLDPFFKFHDQIKVDVLMAYLKLAQLMYYENPPKHLAYSSDDMSVSLLELDPELFLAANYSIYINDSSKTHDAQEAIDRYLQAAMQNQTIAPSAALAAMRQESFHDAEEVLEEAANEAQANAKAIRDEEAKAAQEDMAFKAQQDELAHKRELEKISLKAKEDRITRVATQIILAQGFNEEKDANNNNKADVEDFGQKVIDEARKAVEDAQQDTQISQ